MHSVVMLLTAMLLVSSTMPGDDPDPLALARTSMEANHANGLKASQYAYREYKVQRDLDTNGKETGRNTQTWDVIGLEGSTYRKLIMRNDKPLPAKEQKREDERLRKETELRRKETPEERRNRTFSFSYSLSFPYQKLADMYDLRYAGEETVDGIPASVIEGTPKPGYQATSSNEREALNYKVKLWLAKPDCNMARMELEVVGDHSRMQKGTNVRFESARHDDGVWLTSLITFRFTAKFFKMLNARGEMTMTFSDYHKFQVDSRMVDTGQDR
ncbi:MAG TPA: hypothetical protein VKU19_17660 [Bryobacteraceae bacterium]|nr:hypothetical protein [Bryobacteraceae bacterium]